ncbi:MAG: hypothetical protein OEY50_05965 [Nitrospinota bacterium]|nr:hypothetical protein [Nitrospinota bacterium]MDH5677309.1 hypothetical protein [Nitrospinota bacterium]MDH5755692.1 hypothetical protein [Nitrospinota bacterium]
MSADPGVDGPKSPLHQRFESCAVVAALGRGEPFGLEELKRFAKDLMAAVTEKVAAAGALDIGHIKAVVESGQCFIYANTVGDPKDITVETNKETPQGDVSLTLNAVVLGLEQGKIHMAAHEGMLMTAERYRLEIRKP